MKKLTSEEKIISRERYLRLKRDNAAKNKEKKAIYDKEYNEKNKEKIAKRSKIYRNNNKEYLDMKKKEYYEEKIKPEKKWRNTWNATALRTRFGITEDQYEKILDDQGGVCKICGELKLNSNQSRMGIDHCHETEKLRGILCNSCNLAIGYLNDNISLLQKAIEYLKLNGDDIDIGERIDITKYKDTTRNMRYTRKRDKLKKDANI